MRYDPQSATIFARTDWASLGAIYDPPEDLPRFGAPLTAQERAALGHARLAAESTASGSASETFAQPHPQHATRGIVLICTAWAHRSGGWSIGLIEPTGQESPWVLKADSQAVLRCECHCDWRRECPGVISDPHAPPPPPRPAAPAGWPAPMPPYTPAPAAPAAERPRQSFLSAFFSGPRAPERIGTPQPAPSYPPAPAYVAAAAAPAALSYSGYDAGHGQDVTHHWPAEEYRGHLHGQGEPRIADAVIERAWEPEALPAPEPEIPVARAERTGFWGRMLGRPADPPPAIEPPAAPAQLTGEPGFYHLTADEWTGIPPVDYGGGHTPQIDTAQHYGVATASDHHQLTAADFDQPQASDWPAEEPARLSSQAEIDGFIEAASSYDTPVEAAPEPSYDTAPAYEPEPIAIEYQPEPDPEPVSYDAPPALPAPEEDQR